MATRLSDAGRVIDITWQLPRFSGVKGTRPHHQSRAVASVSILYCGHWRLDPGSRVGWGAVTSLVMVRYHPDSVFELKYSHQRALAGGPKNVYSDKTAKTPPIGSSHPGLSSDMDVGRI